MLASIYSSTHRRNSRLFLLIVTLIVIIMCIGKIFKGNSNPMNKVSQLPDNSNSQLMERQQGFTSGVYYSNWSPYEARKHFPHDIDTEQVSHIYYAFFIIDPKTGKLKSSDEWSDFEMPISKISKLKGCVGELFDMKLNSKNPFKVIMAVGGWSNREAFPYVAKDKRKLTNFVSSCVETMFKYGFDGIDLDWEFPEDDGKEPEIYFEMVKQIRMAMTELENNIYGPSIDPNKRFHLSMATPAFEEKMSILPIKKMDKYIDYWNLMTYDYFGSWSDRTGYHSNLYEHSSNEGLNGDSAVKYMTKTLGINPKKVVLGMAAYGRGFTHVNANDKSTTYVDKKFSGVGGESEGEPGMWLYNQLPIKGAKESYDPYYGAAYCFDDKTKTFVGYDNVESVKVKSQYIKSNNLAGGFWWESCGNTWNNKDRSLVRAFNNEIIILKRPSETIYQDPQAQIYYTRKFGTKAFLSKYYEETH